MQSLWDSARKDPAKHLPALVAETLKKHPSPLPGLSKQETEACLSLSLFACGRYGFEELPTSCLVNADCPEVCIDSVCAAYSTSDGRCDESGDCGPGLDCREGVCKGIEGTGCTSNDDCMDVCIQGLCGSNSALGVFRIETVLADGMRHLRFFVDGVLFDQAAWEDTSGDPWYVTMQGRPHTYDHYVDWIRIYTP